MRSRTRIVVLLVASFAAVLAPTASAPGQERAAPAPGTVTVRGSGADERAATENALLEAVRQVLGVTTEDETMTRKLLLIRGSLQGTLLAPREGDLSIGEEVATGLRERVRTSTRGVVESYRLLARGHDGSVDWVELEVKVAKFDRKQWRDGPFTMAVLPMAAATAVYDRRVDGITERGTIDLGPTAERFTAGVRRLLVQSRRVEVLEREDTAPIAAELARALADSAAAKEAVKLRQQLTADYLLTLAIDHAEVTADAVDLKGLGFSRRQGFDVAVRFQLVETATGVIAAQRLFRVAQPLEAAGKAADTPDADTAGFLAFAFADLQVQLVDALFDVLAPIKVALTETGANGGETVWLNQGGGRFAIGDLFDVFATGVPIVDPDSGEVLDHREMLVATVRAVEVKDRVVVAEVVAGDGKKVAKGAVARRHRSR